MGDFAGRLAPLSGNFYSTSRQFLFHFPAIFTPLPGNFKGVEKCREVE